MPPRAATTANNSCLNSTTCTGASAACTVFSCDILEFRPGFLVFEAGDGAEALFACESGGHRWQRVPPNEKRGRVHTSTVTVAVLPVNDRQVADIRDADVEWTAVRGSGNGGQARNKTSNVVVMTHKPSGIVVRVDESRSQWQNRQSAKRLLAARLQQQRDGAANQAEARSRRQQVGSGQRGDKIRTIRCQDGVVVDHRSGHKMRLARYQQGHVTDLH